MRQLWAFPILALIMIFQSAIVNRIPLLSGTADLMLVVMAAWALQEKVTTAWHWAFIGGLLTGFVSGLPIWLPLVVYLGTVGLARLLQRQVWETPILAMFIITFVGTVFSHFLSFIVLSLTGYSIPLGDSLSLITLPSILLNLIIALPVYVWVKDWADWFNPDEEDL